MKFVEEKTKIFQKDSLLALKMTKINQDSEEKTKKEQIIETLNETVDLTSIHGIPNIVKNKNILTKIMWIIFFLGSVGVCGWFLVTSFLSFFNFDYVTNIEFTYQNQIIFPIVSFCLLKSKSPNNLFSGGINDVLVTCSYQLDTCNSTNDFVSYLDKNYGTCFSFNSGLNENGDTVSSKYVSFRGINGGLEMVLYSGSAFSNTLSDDTGINLMITNETTTSNSVEGA